MIDLPGIRRVDNDDHATTGELVSLAKAIDTVKGDTLVAFGDIIFRRYIVGLLVRDPGDIAIVVDTKFRNKPKSERTYDSCGPRARARRRTSWMTTRSLNMPRSRHLRTSSMASGSAC